MNAKILIQDIDQSRCVASEFKRLAEEYCDLIKSFGYKAKPYRNSGVLKFESCKIEQRTRAIAYLDANIELLKECVAQGDNPRNSAQMLWRILKKIKAVPENDIFDKIAQGDVVEVYLDDHIQIYRNLEFFNYTSFTIDELLCGTWYKLYKRDFLPSLKMMKMAFKLLTKRLNKTTPWNVPEHIFDEIGSEENLRHSILLKYLSPLTNQGKMVGAICISHAKLDQK